MSLRYDPATTTAYAALLRARFGIDPGPPPDELSRPFRGHLVHVDRHAAEGRTRGTVLLVHGAGGHGRLLAPFARPCTRAGFEVLAPDLPGYGVTRLRAGAAPAYPEWIDLLVEVADEAATRGPVVLFGLSVGGMTACRVAERARRVDGVIATTLVDLADPATFDRLARTPLLGKLARLAFRRLHVLDGVALPLRWLTPLGTLTSDPEIRRALLADPLLGGRRVPLGFFRSLHGHRPATQVPRLPCPLLVVHPGADAWTPTSMSRAVFDRLPGDAPRAFLELSNGAHAPLESPAYDELSRAVTAFLEERAA